MGEVTRRDVVKFASASLAVGAGVLATNEVRADDDKKLGDAADRWKGRKIADPKTLEQVTKGHPVSLGVEPGAKAVAGEVELVKELEVDLKPMGTHPRDRVLGGPPEQT